MKIVLIKFLSKLHLGEILCENKIMTYKGNKYKIFNTLAINLLGKV